MGSTEPLNWFQVEICKPKYYQDLPQRPNNYSLLPVKPKIKSPNMWPLPFINKNSRFIMTKNHRTIKLLTISIYLVDYIRL